MSLPTAVNQQLLALRPRHASRERVDDRLREDDAVAGGRGRRPQVRLGSRQPRGRLPRGHREPH